MTREELKRKEVDECDRSDPERCVLREHYHGIDSMRLGTLLGTFMKKRKDAERWLTTPLPEIEGKTPMSLIAEGKERVLIDLLEGLLYGVIT